LRGQKPLLGIAQLYAVEGEQAPGAVIDQKPDAGVGIEER